MNCPNDPWGSQITEKEFTMKIIGEKINGTLSLVKKAVEEKDASFIQDLARRQAEAGAFWLDVNAGTLPEREPDDLAWLVRTVQEVLDLPLCLDSANIDALKAAIREVDKPPLINSISGEPERLEGILPIVSDNNCEVIALALDEKGIPKDVEARMTVIRNLITETRKAGIPDNKVYIDPLVTALATGADSGIIAFETMRKVRLEFPEVHFTMGLSNISFGLPARSVANKIFLTIALASGLDSAIMDPLDRDLMETLLAAELVLGRDSYCQNYICAYRECRIGRSKSIQL